MEPGTTAKPENVLNFAAESLCCQSPPILRSFLHTPPRFIALLVLILRYFSRVVNQLLYCRNFVLVVSFIAGFFFSAYRCMQ